MCLLRSERVLRQHLETDRLLGIEVVPVAEEQVTVSGQTPRRAVENQPALSGDVVDKKHLLDAIDRQEVRSCTQCPLCKSRTQTVFGEGNPDAGLMFVGEGPGQNEDRQGRPFVGRAGEMLNKQIVAMGLTREQVYIANVVKCRPPNNRAPTPIEAQTCWRYLRRQIDIIRPRVIVTLGGPATKLLLETTKGITAIRGSWHRFDQLVPDGPSIPVMPTFHPAYLLRAYTPENRKKVWSDLQKAVLCLQEPGGPDAT